MLPSKSDATIFWAQLAEFSRRVFEYRGHSTWRESPWSGGVSAPARWKGAVIHYTGDQRLWHVVHWFMDARYNARVSAHVVVAEYQYQDLDLLLDGLHLVAQLPTTVVQCRPPDKAAGHARWMNRYAYGIENVGVGVVSSHSRLGWTYTDGSKIVQRWYQVKGAPVERRGQWWTPYPSAQVATNVALLRYLTALQDQPLEPAWVVGHEATDERKRDPGPLYPIHAVRAALFEGLDVEVVPCYGRQSFVPVGPMKEDPSRAETGEIDVEVFAELAMPDVVGPEVSRDKATLSALGYYLDAPEADAWTPAERDSVAIFQRMMGLQADGIAGDKTRTALAARCAALGFEA